VLTKVKYRYAVKITYFAFVPKLSRKFSQIFAKMSVIFVNFMQKIFRENENKFSRKCESKNFPFNSRNTPVHLVLQYCLWKDTGICRKYRYIWMHLLRLPITINGIEVLINDAYFASMKFWYLFCTTRWPTEVIARVPKKLMKNSTSGVHAS
jgi:hypothetical protein